MRSPCSRGSAASAAMRSVPDGRLRRALRGGTAPADAVMREKCAAPKNKVCQQFQRARTLQPRQRKYFTFAFSEFVFIYRHPASCRGAYASSRYVEAGCDGRDGNARTSGASTSDAVSDGQVVWSWHPDADALRWRVYALSQTRRSFASRGHGGQKAGAPGRVRSSRNTIAQGRPDVRLVPVVTAACFLVAGGPWVRSAPGLPCALSLFEGGHEPHHSGASRRETAKPCPCCKGVRCCRRQPCSPALDCHSPRKREIQCAAASPQTSTVSGILDHPPSRMMTTQSIVRCYGHGGFHTLSLSSLRTAVLGEAQAGQRTSCATFDITRCWSRLGARQRSRAVGAWPGRRQR